MSWEGGLSSWKSPIPVDGKTAGSPDIPMVSLEVVESERCPKEQWLWPKGKGIEGKPWG